MADITVTAANVVPQSNAKTHYDRLANVAITAGESVSIDPTTGKIVLADNDAGGAAGTGTAGIAVASVGAGNICPYQNDGDLAIGATLVVGAPYFVSSTGGGICPAADLVTGSVTAFLGIAKSASILSVKVLNPGTAHA